jgi:hypothetical protein
MAIKGKGKSRPRQVARAPRRAPVEVRPPLLQRRWVHLTAALLTGMLATMFVIWVTNGLRQAGEDERAQQEATEQQAAMGRIQATVDTQLGGVGMLQPQQPPVLAPQVGAALAALAEGQETDVTEEDLRTVAADLGAAADALEDFDVAAEVRGKGFGDRAEIILTTRTEIVESLRLHQQAAELALLALGDDAVPGREDIAATGNEVLASATNLLMDAWRKYENQLAEVGLASAAPDPALQLP